MNSNKLSAGNPFPKISATLLNGEKVLLSKPENGADWKLVVVYRGRHCPLCTRFLNELQTYKAELLDTGVDIIAVSGDSLAQLQSHKDKLEVSYPLAYGLSQEEMKQLGLYISIPRSEKETDHNFAEPGLFVINEKGDLHVVDISNNPFVRPHLPSLVSGLKWIRDPENNYPIRGTFES